MKPLRADENKRNTAIALLALFFTMVILAFGSVPLYRMFCQATGFGGTPKLNVQNATEIKERRIKVRFNTDVAPDLPFIFKSLQREVSVRVGESHLVFFQVENRSNQPIVGWATYNVVPHKAGSFFNKMQCFCFAEQIIPPHQTLQLPVSFYIDPQIMEHRSLDNVTTITLSYSFFRFKGGS